MKPVTDPTLLEQLNGSGGGLKPVSDPDLLAQLNGEKEQGMLSRAWDATKQAVKGNAEFEGAGNWQDYVDARAESGHYDDRGFFDKGIQYDMMQIDKAGTFGNVQDQIKMIKDRFPDAQISEDANGNPMLIHGDNKFYINRPGLDTQDIAEVAGESALYALGGGAGAATKGYGLAARMGTTGTAETLLNAGAQKMAGRDEIDKTEMAMAGAAGGLFEGLAPAVSKVWRSMKNSGKSNKEAGKEIAQEMGLALNSEQTERLGDMARNLDLNQVDMKTIVEHVELNQTPTLGTLTKNKDILETENAMRHTGRESTRGKLRMLDDVNETGLNRAVSEFQNTVGGGQSNTSDYLDAAGQIGNAVKNKAQTAKQGVNQAYDGVQDAYLGAEGFTQAPQRIKKALSGANEILDPNVSPRATAALQDLEKSVSKLEGAKGVSWQAVDAQRKRINSMFSGANPSEKRALQVIKNEFDSVVDDAFEKHLLSGDPGTIESLKKARSLAADYFKKFGKNDKYDSAGAVVEKWVNSDVAPEQISNAIFNVNGSLNQKAIPMAKRYLEIVGKDTPEHNLLKEMTVQRLATGKDKVSLRNSLKKALTNQKTFMNEVFTQKELGFMDRTVSFIDDISQKGINARSSGSAERLFRWLNQSAGNDVSLSGLLNGVKKTLSMITGAERRVTALPTQQVAINPAAVGAAQGSTTLHN